MQILRDAVQALIDLHHRGFVHGRPALRDMTWKAGKVFFIDFESHSRSQNLLRKQVCDGLIFIHSLGRSKVLSDKQMRAWLIIMHSIVKQKFGKKSLILLLNGVGFIAFY